MPAVTLADFKTQVYSRLEGNTLMFTSGEVTNAINDGIAIGNMFCGWLNKTEAVPSSTTVANRHIYRVPESIVIPQKCSFEGKALEKVSLLNISRRHPSWLADTTTSTGQEVSRWVPYSLDRFGLHPADAVGGGFLEVTGIANPDKLSSDTDSIILTKDAVLAISEYAAHIVQVKFGGQPFVQSVAMYKSFERLIKQQKLWSDYKQPNMWFDMKQPE